MSHTHPISTRQEAYQQGQRFYYTGIPCKYGHYALRYVTTGTCTACLNKYKTRTPLNPFTKNLVRHDHAIPLWRSIKLVPEQVDQLQQYLQSCIRTFELHILKPSCVTCLDARYVQDGYNGPWKPCTACTVKKE